MRLLSCAVACTSVLIALTLPAAAEALRPPAMQFTLSIEGPESACADACRRLVSASGMIRADTATEFESFAARNDVRGATIVLESEGGSVLGAIALGRSIRRLGMTTTVGRVVELPGARSGAARAGILPRADCESMCAFVLLGGVARHVPDEAHVRVHQIWLGDRREDAVAASYSAEDLSLVQRDIGKLVQYTHEMGGGADLIDVSLRIPPWEPMRTLTPAELRRMRLDIGDRPEPVTVASSDASATPVSGGAARIVAGRDRGWLLGERAGAPALTRRHPLTVEGEEIGYFDLSIACGPAGEYRLTYTETRRGRAGRTDAPASKAVRSVQIRIGTRTAMLAVQSSEWRADATELDTLARGSVPATFVRPLTDHANRSLTVTTAGAPEGETAIRIGNAGLAGHYRQFASGCGLRAEAGRVRLSRSD